jgi:hypothetical protein
VAFGIAYAWDLYRELGSNVQTASSLRQARIAVGVFATSIAFVLIVLWPSKNLQPNVVPSVARVVHKVAPATYHLDTYPKANAARMIRTAADPAPQEPQIPTPMALNLGMGSLKIAGRIRAVFVYPIAGFAPLAILVEALVFALAWQRGKPLLLVAPLLLGVFIVEIYLRLWHTSLMWVVLIMVLWAVWDEREKPTSRTLQSAVAAVFTLVCLLQIPWTIEAVRFERTHPTYPAKAAADYLKTLPQDARFYGFDHAFTVLPYFPEYPFEVQNDVLDVKAVLGGKPDAILLRDSTATAEQMAELVHAGYQRKHVFCGTPFFPNQNLVPLCLDVLEKP